MAYLKGSDAASERSQLKWQRHTKHSFSRVPSLPQACPPRQAFSLAGPRGLTPISFYNSVVMDSEIRLTIAPIEQIAVAMENTRFSAQQMLATCQAKIDQAAAVARLVVDIQMDIEENIRSSTERWFELQRDVVVRIAEGMNSSMAHMAEMMTAAAASFERYCKEEAPETCTLLWQAGWVGMDHHFSITELRESVLLHKEEGEAAMNDGILAYFNEDDCALLEAISRHWVRIPYLRDREQIIRDAVYAHKNGLFTLSIPALLPLIDGLSAEIIGLPSMKAVALLAEDRRAHDREVWMQGFCDFVAHVYYKGYDFGKEPAPYLNRHGILHGRVFDYPSALNSTRVLLLIDAVAQIWHEKENALAPATIQ